MSMVAFLVSFLASTAGAICGIGGGVIIKPVLDLFQMASVSTISFLSGCTVLSMSLYSVGRAAASRDSVVDFKTGTPLALGAALGGVLGKQLFTAVKEAASNPNMVGGVQAGCLTIITIYTLAYTVNKANIKTRRVRGTVPCVIIGITLVLCRASWELAADQSTWWFCTISFRCPQRWRRRTACTLF